MRFPSSRSLSMEEEDELEGRAGDTGSVYSSRHSGSLVDIDLPSREFPVRNSGAIFPDSGEAGTNFPLDLNVPPVAAKPPLGVPAPPQIAVDESSEHLHNSLEILSILSYLTTFGIIGVVIRYLLEELFGPGVAKLTSNQSALFTDLPANMFGSFFMGWVGVVFKRDIAMYSEHLAVGLSTGLMGSITTYAAMIQRNLAVMVTENRVTGFFGLLIGLYLAQMSLVVGEDSARLLLYSLEVINNDRDRRGLKKWKISAGDNLKRRKVGLVLFLSLGSGLWMTAVALTTVDTTSISRRTLWLACCFGPPGVWIRWYFARLNGQGIGPKHYHRWFPVGTFLVNVTASSLEAALTTVNNAIGNYRATLVVGGINLGMLGCLSTVSTFVAEIQTMHEGSNRWRSYAYPILSIAVSLFIGLLVYAVPVLCKVVPAV